jgi:hypothetical protein
MGIVVFAMAWVAPAKTLWDEILDRLAEEIGLRVTE